MKQQTLRWIRKLERGMLAPDTFSNVPKAYAERFISNATVLNELMSEYRTNYVRDFVDRLNPAVIWNKYYLKSFVMLDYPLSVIETIFREEKKSELRQVLAGLFPFNSGKKINACAKRSPFGDDVIFFSEWLFVFLWDYYHLTANVLPEGTISGEATSEQIKEMKKIEEHLVEKLKSGSYHNWNTDIIANSESKTNSSRYYLLMALIFIWSHELGHIFLGHHLKSNTEKESVSNYNNNPYEMETYNYNQTQEFDADMFASDLYFQYLYKGIKKLEEPSFKSLHVSSFDFLMLIAKTQKDKVLGDFRKNTHPPAVLRLAYIYLRHKERLIANGFHAIIDGLKGNLSKSTVPEYDYMKELGVDALTI